MESLASCKDQRSPSFAKFNDLPPELRIKVWQAAMPEARTVIVKAPHASQDSTTQSLDNALVHEEQDDATWTSNTQIPALLHVNAEARYEALKHYQLSLGVGEKQPQIYVDFTKDTIFIGNAELSPANSSLWSSTTDMEKIERLAVVPEGAWRVLRTKKLDFGKLQKLTFVHDTEKANLGATSQLKEDEATEDDIEELAERIEQAQRLAPVTTQSELVAKERLQAAREELDTLMMVLPTVWDKEPVIATAVFV